VLLAEWSVRLVESRCFFGHRTKTTSNWRIDVNEKEPPESGAICAPVAVMVDVLVADIHTPCCGELSQLSELVL
jgi:hypothetical protein